MFNISNLLEKFQKQIKASELTKQEILNVVSRHSGVMCQSESVEIKNYILYLDISPTLKNKIFLHKKEILEDFSNISSVKIVDIT